LGIPQQKALTEILQGSTVEVTREKVQVSLVSHSSGLKLLLASENPRDVSLTSQVKNYEVLMTRLASLARFVVLDLGVGLPQFVQKVLPMCNERVVVLEGALSTIQKTKYLIDEIANLGADRKGITAVLNNRVRSEVQTPWAQVQEKLGHSIAITLTPAPELFVQAARLLTPAVVCQPTNVTSQQFLKIADLILEREKAR
jgi:MinD-like ATPase involved in chromosome partitioning or flagellar assembly